MEQLEYINEGRFDRFTRNFIEEDYTYEKDILLLIGSYNNFIDEAGSIGSDSYRELIMAGRDHSSASELAYQEIKSFVVCNINTY
jgi:hypothetical protein